MSILLKQKQKLRINFKVFYYPRKNATYGPYVANSIKHMWQEYY